MARRVENQLLLHQSYRTCNRDLLDIFKKKKMKGKCNQRKKFPLLSDKQKKQKQNKTNPISISNVSDQPWLGLVLNCCQASADLQQCADLTC